PHLAAAQRAGQVTPEQVSLIDTALGKVKHCDPDAVEAGEIFLVDHADKLGYQDLDRAAAS
ncbi:MAG TPA: HNH endonuclease, partial [Microlunatus sp.]|nr:HNH endonuclease [Microlunatus sp.]